MTDGIDGAGRPLPENFIQSVLSRMAAGGAPSIELVEAAGKLRAARLPRCPREPGLLQRQGAAWNYVRRYRKKYKRTPPLKEITRRFGLNDDRANAVTAKSVNDRIGKEAARQRSEQKNPHFAESADFCAPELEIQP